MSKDIFIILPYKESLNPNLAGAVSLYVKDTTEHSQFKKKIRKYFFKRTKFFKKNAT